MPLKILCTIGDIFALEGKKILESLGSVDYATPTQKQIAGVIGKYDVVVAQLGITFDATILKRAKHLKILATPATGTDHIDLAAAEKLGITVISLKHEIDFLRNIPSTAEHTWGLLLALIRNTMPAFDDVRDGTWEGKPFAGTELKGKTLGVIGVGRLGTIVAGYGKAFGMNVIGCDLSKIPSSVCKQVKLEPLLRQSDVVTLHVHLTEETHHLMNAARLRMMKSTAVLMNTARGKIVDQTALLKALKGKKIAGYAADVLEHEMQFGKDCSGDPLVRFAASHGNVLLTPHIGGRTYEARMKTDVFIAARIKEALSSKKSFQVAIKTRVIAA